MVRGRSKSDNSPLLSERVVVGKQEGWKGGDLGVFEWGSKKKFEPCGRQLGMFVQEEIQSLCTGFHSLVALNDGSVWSWGNNLCGQLGLGEENDKGGKSATSFKNKPERVEALRGEEVIFVCCSIRSSGAVTRSGKLYIWGEIEERGRGLSTTSSPTLIYFSEGGKGGGRVRDGLMRSVLGGEGGKKGGVREAGFGVCHKVALWGEGGGKGVVYCWGRNSRGQLGVEGEEIVYSDPQPVEYLLNYDIISIAVGDHHSVALSSRGHVFVWGQNIRRTLTAGVPDEPFLGTGLTSEYLWTPTKVSFLSRIKPFKVVSGSFHLGALVKVSSSENRLYMWGENNRGQVGVGTLKRQTNPARIHGLNFAEVVCGKVHSVGITANGQIYSWGAGDRGALGFGAKKDVLTPTRLYLQQKKIEGEMIAAGEENSLAVLHFSVGMKKLFGASLEGTMAAENGFLIPDFILSCCQHLEAPSSIRNQHLYDPSILPSTSSSPSSSSSFSSSPKNSTLPPPAFSTKGSHSPRSFRLSPGSPSPPPSSSSPNAPSSPRHRHRHRQQQQQSDQHLPLFKEKRKIREIVEQGHDFDPSFYSISAVCGVLVDFLKELPSPLLTYELYPNFVSLDPNNLVTYLWGMKILLMKLPEPNLMLLSYLVKHWVSVAFCGEFNGVTFEKLGKLLPPAILRPNPESDQSLIPNHPEDIVRDLLKYGHILFDDMAIRLIGIFTESRPVGKWEGEVGREVVQIIGELKALNIKFVTRQHTEHYLDKALTSFSAKKGGGGVEGESEGGGGGHWYKAEPLKGEGQKVDREVFENAKMEVEEGEKNNGAEGAEMAEKGMDLVNFCRVQRTAGGKEYTKKAIQILLKDLEELAASSSPAPPLVPTRPNRPPSTLHTPPKPPPKPPGSLVLTPPSSSHPSVTSGSLPTPSPRHPISSPRLSTTFPSPSRPSSPSHCPSPLQSPPTSPHGTSPRHQGGFWGGVLIKGVLEGGGGEGTEEERGEREPLIARDLEWLGESGLARSVKGLQELSIEERGLVAQMLDLQEKLHTLNRQIEIQEVKVASNRSTSVDRAINFFGEYLREELGENDYKRACQIASNRIQKTLLAIKKEKMEVEKQFSFLQSSIGDDAVASLKPIVEAASCNYTRVVNCSLQLEFFLKQIIDGCQDDSDVEEWISELQMARNTD